MNGDHYMVDAVLTEESQLASLGQTWRANLRKADKAGVTISELADYAQFEELYAQMTQRKNVLLLRPVDVVPALKRGLPERLQPKGLIAHHDGEPVAGIIYGVLGDTAYYLYGATNAKSLPVRAGYKLQWAVLERIRRHARWYDLGQSSGDEGMRQFKSGLIGKAGTLVEIPSEFDYASGWRAKLALRVVYGLREVRRAYLRMRRAFLR
jgi:lipid II:glycine glycyltransferase (peptidoglycan interpeptide bridge formation enzyme)